jgi:deazaflavin-dependent oxidoreductase (nitroreductase family)
MQKPLIAAFRPLTTRLFNPISRRFASRLPGFAIIRYVGRRSGRTYRTPMNVFRRDGDYVFALTYGPDVQWVRNVIAAGECELEQMGRTIRLRDPRRFSDPKASVMPLPVRFFLRLIRVTEFLQMSPGRRLGRRTLSARPKWVGTLRNVTDSDPCGRLGCHEGAARGLGPCGT